MAHYLWNSKFSIQISQPVSALSHINPLKNRCSSVVEVAPAEAETYYSNMVFVPQHKIGRGVRSEGKVAET
jgi:hypothetical protein